MGSGGGKADSCLQRTVKVVVKLAPGDRRKEIADRGSMNLELRGCGVICEVMDLKRGLERMMGFSDKERTEMGARGRCYLNKYIVN